MRSVHTIPLDPGRGGRASHAISHDSGIGGPRVAITANVHGDETTGVAAVLELDRWLANHLSRGIVTLYPSLNPIGLEGCHRTFSPGGVDLNRVFPGNARGDRAHRAAAAIWADLGSRELDVLLDLHSDSASAIPYAIVDRAVEMDGAGRVAMKDRLRALAGSTGLTVLNEYPDDQYRRFSLDRSLAGAMVNHARTPALTIECGPRRAVQADAVNAMIMAVRGVLSHIGVVDGRPADHPSRVDGSFRRASAPRIAKAGIFTAVVRPGQTFEADDVLGQITALDGSILERVLAPAAGVSISWMEAAWVEPRGVVGTLGLRE